MKKWHACDPWTLNLIRVILAALVSSRDTAGIHMSGRNGAEQRPKGLDALLTNLARAGWYSAPILDAWCIDTGIIACGDHWRSSFSNRVGQLQNASAVKVTGDRCSSALLPLPDAVTGLIGMWTARDVKSQNAAKRIHWDDARSSRGGTR